MQQAVGMELSSMFLACYSSHPIPCMQPLGPPHCPQAQDHQFSERSNMIEMESHLDYGQPHVFVS